MVPPSDKKSKNISLDLFYFVSNLCKKNNIKYKRIKNNNIAIKLKDFPLFEDKAKSCLPKQYQYNKVLYSGAEIINVSTTFIAAGKADKPKKYSGYSIYIDLIIPSPRKRWQKKSFRNDLKDLVSNSWIYDNYPDLSPFSLKQLKDAKEYFLHLHQDSNSSITYGLSLNKNIPGTSGFYDPYHPFSKYQKKYNSLKSYEKEIMQKISNSPGKYFQLINSLEYQSRNQKTNPRKNLFKKLISILK